MAVQKTAESGVGHDRRARFGAAVCGAAVLCLTAAGAWAQQKPTKISLPPRGPSQESPGTGGISQPAGGAGGVSANTGLVELAKEPFRLESVGLTMYLPLNATAQATKIGTRITAQILPEDSTWLVNVQTPQTSNPRSTVQEALEQTEALIQGSFGVMDPGQTKVISTEARTLRKIENLRLKGGPAARLYMSVPGGSGDSARIVKGYTIFKPSASQYVVFELICAESEFQRASGVYETLVGSAEFADPMVMASERGAAVKAGVALISRLTSEDYDAVTDGVERWYRLHRPAPTGSPGDAEEVGYRGVRFWKGKRGETDSSRAAGRWTQTDHQQGYLARIRARVVSPTGFIDSDGTFFMTPNRREEAWLVKMVSRDRAGKTMGSWTEIGARDGPEMTVSIDETGRPARVVRPLIQGEGYVTMVEAFVLAPLMIRMKTPTEFGFYSYRSETGGVSLRRDTLSRSGDAWRIKTEFREDDPAQEALYTDRGELIWSEPSEGLVWKPIEPEKLMDLWRQKGLPTGPTRGR